MAASIEELTAKRAALNEQIKVAKRLAVAREREAFRALRMDAGTWVLAAFDVDDEEGLARLKEVLMRDGVFPKLREMMTPPSAVETGNADE